MKPRMRVGAREVWDGYHVERNGIADADWVTVWIVEIDFDSELEAMKFVDELRNRECSGG